MTRFGSQFTGTATFVFLLACWLQFGFAQEPASPKIAKVFVLAGQSNMAGHGVVDLMDEKDYNGGRGTLLKLANAKKSKDRYAHLMDEDGSWTKREDVWIRYETDHEIKKGNLGVGYSAYKNERHHFGPELQFGHIVGDAFEEPVVLIKTAWGGKSLFKDFRPPSSGGNVGPFYQKMLQQVDSTLQNFAGEFPMLKDYRPEIAGFVWQQGWNDMIDKEATKEYETNLLNLIKDVRDHFHNEELPFVYGELGNGGKKANANMFSFRAAQAMVDTHGDENVRFVETTGFARASTQSPNRTHLHHWYGNAESYFLVGDALGKAMVKAAKTDRLPNVLILGDSISIGYTPHVRNALAGKANVYRAVTTQGKIENCKSTQYGIKNVDRWLKAHDCKWDVIHFNWGLHDIKHRDPKDRKKASMKPSDPMWVTPKNYERDLRKIVFKLRASGAKLIFATTTPVPQDVKPFRLSTDVGKYNEIAEKVVKPNLVVINDLNAFAAERLDEIQQPNNVHFSSDGSKVLGEQVAKVVEQCLPVKK